MTGRILKHGKGFERWTTDRGDASGTGYWSAATGEYRPDLLELAFGRVIDVPEVLAPSASAGRTADGMLVAAGTGDNMGAALGLALAPGDVVVSLGTSGTVFTPHDRAIRDETGAIAGFADATGRHLPLMCTLNAARVLTAAAAMLGVDLETLDRLALEADSRAGGLSLLPYLDGERTPDLPGATGTLSGITRSNATPANLARAAVEGMLCNLVAPGLFRVPVVVPRPAEYVGVGAARQAAWALSGAADPPAWDLGVDSEYAVPRGDTSDVTGRYAALLAQLHGR